MTFPALEDFEVKVLNQLGERWTPSAKHFLRRIFCGAYAKALGDMDELCQGELSDEEIREASFVRDRLLQEALRIANLKEETK